MNLGAIKTGAMIIGGATIGGAVIGGLASTAATLKQEKAHDGFTAQNGRDTWANAIIGAGIGAATGIAFLGARRMVPVLGRIPIAGQMPPASSHQRRDTAGKVQSAF